MKRSHIKVLNAISTAYTQVIRGTPMLLQLYIWLYGFPMIGISIPSIPMLGSVYGSREFLTAVVALAINSGAYICELLRGGLDSIDKGQMEAGRSLGFSNLETMRYIIVPQAIRVVLPGLCNEFIMMIKESSIVSVVGVFDIMYVKKPIVTRGSLISAVLCFLRGAHVRDTDHFVYMNAREVRLQASENVMQIHCDGEAFSHEGRWIECEILPGILNLYRPEV